ncbi:MAG: DUF429 domain-containing protein [Hyphomicrobiales bacterium]
MASPPILTISSLVAWGSVGNAIIVPALVAMGIAPRAVPTITLSNHPGLGKPSGQRLGDTEFAALLDTLAASAALADCRGVLTGYFASPAQVAAAAATIRRLKQARPGLLYLCDPVVGDEAGLYVPDAVATAVRDLLIPLADISTPNRFELAWLTGLDVTDEGTATIAARAMGTAEVVATSISFDGDRLGLCLVTGADTRSIVWPRLDGVPHGTGDLFAGLYLGARVLDAPPAEALDTAASILKRTIAANIGADEIDLPTLSRIVAAKPSASFSAPRAGAVVGVDGCRGRWLAVSWNGRPDDEPEARLLDTFAEVLALDADVVAVDMPIGLPDRLDRAGRRCEAEVRALIGERRSSVFAIPARPAVEAADYGESCRLAMLHSDPPRKVAKQAFMLFPKIREIDALMSTELQERVLEVHPELIFYAMNGNQPLSLPKKVKGRPFDDGLALRRRLLAGAGFPIDRLKLVDRARKAGADDILDACAAAWSARRIRDGEHVRLPATPQRDGKGLRMEINA